MSRFRIEVHPIFSEAVFPPGRMRMCTGTNIYIMNTSTTDAWDVWGVYPLL